MQTDHPPPRTSSPRVRIIWLVGVHVVVGLLLGAITAVVDPGPDLLSASLIGLVLSQTSLLGIWIGAGSDSWWTKLIGVAIGAGYYASLSEIGGNGNDPQSVFFFSFVLLIVTAVLLMVRCCFGPHICLYCGESTIAYRLRFSIQHVMLLTFVVACLLVWAKWLQQTLDFHFLPPLILVGLPFIVVGLVAAWGVLGTKRPLIGVVVLFVVALGAGYGLGKVLGPGPGFEFWMTATFAEALSLTISLLVVRSCGYGLRRRSVGRPSSQPEEITNRV